MFIVLVCFHLFFSGKFLLVDPPIYPDETYFFSLSTDISDQGITRTPIHKLTLNNQDVSDYFYPPLFTYIQSFWMMLFGTQLVSIRILSLCISILVLLVSYILFFSVTKSVFISVLSLLIIVLYGPFAIASKVGRMEIIILLFFMSAFLLITRLPFNKKLISIAGLLSTFTWLIHPIGLFLYIFLLIYLFVKRPPNMALKTIVISMILPFILGTSWWIWHYSNNLNIFIEQIKWELFNKPNRESIVTLLFRTDVIWRIRFLFMMVINTFAISIGVRYKNNILLVLGSISWLMLLTTYVGLEQWYLVYPLFPLILTLLAMYSQLRTRWVITLCLFFLFSLNAYTTLTYYLSESNTNNSYRLFVNEVSSHIPKDAKILTSTIPDPTFELWNLGYKHIQAVPHTSEPNRILSHFDDFDILLINYTTNVNMETIINTRKINSMPVESQGYSTNVVFLH